ncbi:hypothetical protein [Cryobacterium sp. N22]|uniref:hypothetical protein n=1 Tax=Cryobacterium sp. N22 TaxID=2048290 RepID=UPI000CE42B59|nr:hypothetical protein [Cryobacterium sp. N22]
MQTEIDSDPDFDDFWRDHFAKKIAADMPVARILASVEMLALQRADRPVDLSLCRRMPGLRDLLLPGAPGLVTNKEVIADLPALRELVIAQGSFTPEDLTMVAKSASLTRLHISNMHLDAAALAVLDEAPKLKQLSLSRVTGLTAADLALLPKITRLRLSECDLPDIANLARMPRLRTLELYKMVTANLDFLAAPKLVSFQSDDLAEDQTGLGHLAKRTQLHTFSYPVSDLSVLASCIKVQSIVVDASAEVDLNVIAHLPITGIVVHFAPNKAAVEAIFERAEKIWPKMRMTGFREDWTRPRPAAEPERAVVAEPVPAPAPAPVPVPVPAPAPAASAIPAGAESPRRPGFLARLLRKATAGS